MSEVGREMPRSAPSRGLTAAQLLAAGAGTLLVVQVAPYLLLGRNHLFLVERQVLTDTQAWYTAFLVHVAGGIVALCVAPFLLWNGLRGGNRRLHRLAGKVFALAALGWVAPSGAFLAWHAKGGASGRIGFAVLVALLVACVVRGLFELTRRRLSTHAAWMVRAYALLLSAFGFRIVFAVTQRTSLSPDTAYALAVWMSIAGSLLGGEWVLRWLPKREGGLQTVGGVA